MRKIKLVVEMAIFVCAIGTFSSPSVFANTSEVVTLGANLSSSQREDMFKEFGVKPSDAEVITMDVNKIREELGLPKVEGNLKGNAYSSVFVKVEDAGYGIDVRTSNLTEVTNCMLRCALLTSGVSDASIIATSPFPVSGTSALAGVLEAFQKASGEDIPLSNREVSRQELSITNNLSSVKDSEGQAIGKDGASYIVNEAKKDVIKDKPKSDKAVGEIADGVLNKYDITLTKTQEQELVGLLANINSLNLDYSKLKGELENISCSIQKSLDESGQNIKKSSVLDKMLNKILGVYNDLKDWFLSNFRDGEVTINGVTYDKDGNMVNKDQLKNIGTSVFDDAKYNKEGEIKDSVEDKADKGNESSNAMKENMESSKPLDCKKSDANDSKDNIQASLGNASTNKTERESNNSKGHSQGCYNKDRVDSSKEGTNKDSKGCKGSNREENKLKETIELEDGTKISKYSANGKEYNKDANRYDSLKGNEKEDKTKNEDKDELKDYIMVDGKKVLLHDEKGREYNPETGGYGDPED